MNNKTSLAILITVLLGAFCGHAQDQKPKTRDEALKLIHELKPRQGEINLKDGLAKLQVPKEFNYYDPEDTEKVLVRLWGNPPGSKSLGMLIPAEKTPLDEDCWVVTLNYTGDGYVKDNDANKINYDDLLKSMKKSVQEANTERQKQGYSAVELVGWAAPPRYDAATHKLYWAKELKFGGQPENTLNYNIRMLGRRGVLVLNAVAPVAKLADIEARAPQILGMVNFNDGNRYADFDPKSDKVAAYGLAALVAGGIAAKLGLFKVLWVFILAAKKFIIIGFVAAVAWIKKLVGRKKNTPMS